MAYLYTIHQFQYSILSIFFCLLKKYLKQKQCKEERGGVRKSWWHEVAGHMLHQKSVRREANSGAHVFSFFLY